MFRIRWAQHQENKFQLFSDSYRDDYLKKNGWKVIHIENSELLKTSRTHLRLIEILKNKV